MSLTVVNDPPIFTVQTLPNKEILLNSNLELTFTNVISDPENHPITIIFKVVVGGIE